MTYIVEVVGIIAGIVYMIMGITKYGVWEGISISGGFMPLVCGGFLTLFCVLMLISKIKKGEKADSIDKKALSFFDDVKHEWMTEPGKFEAVIGTSSRDIKGIVPFELR